MTFTASTYANLISASTAALEAEIKFTQVEAPSLTISPLCRLASFIISVQE